MVYAGGPGRRGSRPEGAREPARRRPATHREGPEGQRDFPLHPGRIEARGAALRVRPADGVQPALHLVRHRVRLRGGGRPQRPVGPGADRAIRDARRDRPAPAGGSLWRAAVTGARRAPAALAGGVDPGGPPPGAPAAADPQVHLASRSAGGVTAGPSMSSPSPSDPLAVVLLSGGMDSCVTAALARRTCTLALLHVSYGQRTEERELHSFREIARHYGDERRLQAPLQHPKGHGGAGPGPAPGDAGSAPAPP